MVRRPAPPGRHSAPPRLDELRRPPTTTCAHVPLALQAWLDECAAVVAKPAGPDNRALDDRRRNAPRTASRRARGSWRERRGVEPEAMRRRAELIVVMSDDAGTASGPGATRGREGGASERKRAERGRALVRARQLARSQLASALCTELGGPASRAQAIRQAKKPLAQVLRWTSRPGSRHFLRKALVDETRRPPPRAVPCSARDTPAMSDGAARRQEPSGFASSWHSIEGPSGPSQSHLGLSLAQSSWRSGERRRPSERVLRTSSRNAARRREHGRARARERGERLYHKTASRAAPYKLHTPSCLTAAAP